MQTKSWPIMYAPQDRDILAWYPDAEEWAIARFTGIFCGVMHFAKGRDTESKEQPTRWAEMPATPYKPAVERNVTDAQAESYNWWEHYLQARMDALQAMVLLGKDDAEIRRVIGTDGPHVDRLLCVARGRLEAGS